MKLRMLTMLVLALMLLSACSAATLGSQMDAAGDAVENSVDAAEDAVEDMVDGDAAPENSASGNAASGNAASDNAAPEDTGAPAEDSSAAQTPSPDDAALTREQAEEIALEHAGFTADQVTGMQTEYEIDNGVAQYDVQFHEGNLEYEFEIHAETGEILSFDKDD